MLKDLFHLGPITVRGYGLSIGIAILLGFSLTLRELRRAGRERLESRILSLLAVVVLSATLGGKLFFIAFYQDVFQRILRESGLLGALTEGFVYYGALLTAIPATIVFLRRLGEPVLPTLDLLIFNVPLAHGLGRIGCFLAGCCFGCRSSSPLAVSFPAGHVLAGVPVHPVQLYEAAANFAILAFLWFGPRRRARFAGQTILSYLGLYALLRFVTEGLRGDANPVWIGERIRRLGDPPPGLTTAQVTSLALFAVVLAAYVALARRARRRTPRSALRES